MVIPAKNSCTTIAVDFDGTIYDRETGSPYPYANKALKWFRRWGYTIIIFSSRASSDDAKKWIQHCLKENGIVFDEITNVKPSKLTWLIDDRGIYFNNHQPNWHEITEAIKMVTIP